MVIIFFTSLPQYYLTSFQNLLRLNVIFMVRKIGQLLKIFRILIVPWFWLIFDDVTVTLSLVLLSLIFFHKLTFVLSYSMPKFAKIECHPHG